MISRTYTVNPGRGENLRCYKGFDQDYTGSKLDWVVLVMTEGEIDVYAIDSPKSGVELLRYLCDEGFQSTILGCYKRV